MLLSPVSRLLLTLVLTTLLPATAAAQPEPWRTLPWSDGRAGPAFRPGGQEQQPEGPTALAAAGDAVWIADPVARRVWLVREQGDPLGIETPFPPLDLAADGNGRLALLDQSLERVAWRDADGPWTTLPFSRPDCAPRRLAWDREAGLWIQCAEGKAVPVSKPADARPQRVLPLGDGALQGLVRRADDHLAVIWTWPWTREADFKDDQARRLEIRSEQRLGVVHLLSADASARTIVLVETRSDGTPVETATEVRGLDRDGRTLASARLQGRDAAPIYRRAAVGPDGTLWILRTALDGVRIFRFPADSWSGKVEVP